MKSPDILGVTGVVGSGGGLLGAISQVGAESLILHGIFPEYFCGVSASALNFAALSRASSKADLISKLEYPRAKWEMVAKGGPGTVFNYSKFSVVRHLTKPGLLENDTLYALLDTFDPEESVRSPFRFDVCVCEHVGGNEVRYVIFSNHDDCFNPDRGGDPRIWKDVICASASITPFFPPIYIPKLGKYYSDGDFYRIIPAILAGCDTIFVFHCYPQVRRVVPEPSLGKP